MASCNTKSKAIMVVLVGLLDCCVSVLQYRLPKNTDCRRNGYMPLKGSLAPDAKKY